MLILSHLHYSSQISFLAGFFASCLFKSGIDQPARLASPRIPGALFKRSLAGRFRKIFGGCSWVNDAFLEVLKIVALSYSILLRVFRFLLQDLWVLFLDGKRMVTLSPSDLFFLFWLCFEKGNLKHPSLVAGNRKRKLGL